MLPVKDQHRLKGGKIGPILPAKVNGSADIGARLAMLARGGAAHSRRKTNIGPTLCAAWDHGERKPGHAEQLVSA